MRFNNVVSFISLLCVILHTLTLYGDNSTQKVDNSVYYKASDVSHSDLNNDILILSGDAEVKNSGYTINADKVIFNTKTNVLESIIDRNTYKNNNKRIKISTKNGETIYCDNLKYSVKKNVGVAKNALLFKNNTIILAKIAKIDYDGRYYCSNVSMTSCKKKDPDWAVIIDNVIVYKNLFYLYGAKLMLNGVYFPFIKKLGFPYLLPETRKSGLKYPESINFGSYGGLAIKNFGFYIYFNKHRDLNCNISAFLGDSSFNFSLIHNYIKPDSYGGTILFSLNKISLYKIIYGYEEEFETSWEFSWKHSTLSYKNYEFSSDLYLANSYGDDSASSEKKNLNANIYFKIKSFLKFFSFDIGVKYNKNFDKKLEEFEIPYFNLGATNITFLKYFSFTPTINGGIFFTNENRKPYLKDKHDITMENDILGNKEVLCKDRIFDFFKNLSCQKIANIFKNLSYELKIGIPLRIDYKIINVSLEYNSRLFFSKYDGTSIKIRKFPYYIHSINAKTNITLKMMSPKAVFNECSSKNLLKIKELRYNKDVIIGVNYNPSLDKMQRMFGLEESYINRDGKVIDMFYHTHFGNLKGDESLVLNVSYGGYLEILRVKNDEDYKVKLFDFNVSTGYDFLKKKCKLDDIKTNINITLFRLNIETSCVFYPYQYSETLVDNNREKIDKWFFDNNRGFCKSFLQSIMSFSVDVNCELFDNKKKNAMKNKKIDKKKADDEYALNKKVEYDKFYIWENLRIAMKYTFKYENNPIIRDKNISHLVSLDLSTLLSKKCNIACSIVYNIKDMFINSLNINGSYDLHCWVIRFAIALTTDKKKDRKLRYDVSIAPKITTFSFLSQHRGETLSVF